MSNIGTLPGDRLAGLSADLFHKLQKGAITLEELALFTQRKNPFVFERNEHGHIVLTITGLDLMGEQEVERLIVANFRVGDWAKSCLLSTSEDGYDKKHRLIAGQEYKIALMPTKEIEHDSDRTFDALRKRGVEKYGYEKSLAGIIPRIRETVSDKQMEEMGFWYITAMHEPINDSGGGPCLLGAGRNDGGRWLRAYYDDPDDGWYRGGGVAFVVSQV